MTARLNVMAIDKNSDLDEVMEIMIENNYSRYPVYDGDLDNIVGIIYFKDFVKEYLRDKTKSLAEIMVEATFVHPTYNIAKLFRRMQTAKIHMVIVVDEYGQTEGIVTMEDILEEIVGNIFDEHDEEELEYELIDENTYMVNGNISIGDLEKIIGIEISDGDYETLSGYLLGKLEELPPEGEETIIEDGKLTYKIEEYEDKRIKRVKICKNK